MRTINERVKDLNKIKSVAQQEKTDKVKLAEKLPKGNTASALAPRVAALEEILYK